METLRALELPFSASLYAFAIAAMAAETLLFRWLERPRDKASRWLGIRCGLLSFGLGAVFTSFVTVSAQTFLYAHRVFDLGLGPSTWALCFVVNDLMFYVSHRLSHEVRFLWSVHAVHHSSRHFDLTAGIRGSVLDALVHFPFVVWIPLLGIHPIIVVFVETGFRFYGLAYHTDLVGRLGVLEKLLVTPSHHRVHHGTEREYLDKNYGGFFILWDKLFGTFEPERARPTYGLTHPFSGTTVVDAQLVELRPLMRDVGRARGWRQTLRTLTRMPPAA